MSDTPRAKLSVGAVKELVSDATGVEAERIDSFVGDMTSPNVTRRAIAFAAGGVLLFGTAVAIATGVFTP